MNKIILVRHGEPDVKTGAKISGAEIPSFLKRYNEAPLIPNSLPSSKLLFLSANATVICSDLKRSYCSAQRCGVSPKIEDAIFSESIPPHFQNAFLRLKPKTWLLLSRVLWLMGFSLHGESYKDAKKRAKRAADILLHEVKKRDVLLFGHGLFNILIAAELRKRGFVGPKVPARNFWEFGVYQKFTASHHNENRCLG